jgi:hypothetical protein
MSAGARLSKAKSLHQGLPRGALQAESRGGESWAGETCQHANAQGLVECPVLGTAPGDGRGWGGH